jgi:hypothetical protein
MANATIAGIADLTEPLRAAMAADGARLELRDLRSGIATFGLAIGDAACEASCVLPGHRLAELLLSRIRSQHEDFTGVDLADDRETDTVEAR